MRAATHNSALRQAVVALRPISPGRAANINRLATLKEVEDTPTPSFCLHEKRHNHPPPSVSRKRPSHLFLKQQIAFRPDHLAYLPTALPSTTTNSSPSLSPPKPANVRSAKGFSATTQATSTASSAAPASTAATKAPQLCPPTPQPPTRFSTAGSTRSASSTPVPSSTASRSTTSSCWTYGS